MVVGQGKGVAVGCSVARDASKGVAVGPAVGRLEFVGPKVALAPIGTFDDEVLQLAETNRMKNAPKRKLMRVALVLTIVPIKVFGAGSAVPPEGSALGCAISTTRA